MQEVVLHHPNALARAAVAAYQRVQPHVLQTPLLHSHWLSGVAPDCTVYCKLESEQHTNSFKLRGAINKLLSLTPAQLQAGLVTSSTGNAALALVAACRAVPGAQSAPSTIYLPTTASAAKLSRLLEQGACVVQHGADCVLAEQEARRIAEERGMVYVSPYNDFEVMAGQGTVAVELLQQLPGGLIDVCIVPVGGGGLIAGIAAVLKASQPGCQVIGVQPTASDVMRQCVAAGRIVDVPCGNTLSDATAGGIEQDALTLQPCIEYVDEYMNLSEQEIADAMVSFLQHHGKLVEGAAGCAVAAVRQLGARLSGKRVVVVCCGGNVALSTLQRVLATGEVW